MERRNSDTPLKRMVPFPELRLCRLLPVEWRGKGRRLRLPHCSSLSFSLSFAVVVRAMDFAPLQPLQPHFVPPALALHPPPPALAPLFEAAPALEVLLLPVLIE